jgi:S-adenosylmethionine hydrolase
MKLITLTKDFTQADGYVSARKGAILAIAHAAAHLVKGTLLRVFGRPVHNPVLLDIPELVCTGESRKRQILSITAFGNLSGNITKEYLEWEGNLRIILKENEINSLGSTFGDARSGELAAMTDSFGCLSISILNGSAAEQLDVLLGEPAHAVYE